MSVTRRDFVTRALGSAGALLALDSPALARVAAIRKAASDRVSLGRTGITVSRLAMGSGTHGSNHASDQTRLGKGFVDLLCNAFDQGVDFFETADQYGAHPQVGEAMKRVGRQKVVVLTKTHATTHAEAWADLDRFRRELGTDHIDVVLLHCMTRANWNEERRGAMDALEEARQKGVIRAHGVSCHRLDALKVASKDPWVQVDLARINPIGAHMDADPETVISVLREMKAAGKGVIGMKIFAQGDLSATPGRAIEHAVKLDCIDAFTIGFRSPAELEQVVRKMPTVAA